MITALYAGSFDPITNGHLDILESASKMFDKVIIAVAYNPDKTGFISVQSRVNLIKDAVKNYKNVEVDSYIGLTVEYAKKKGASVLIRGLRTASDFEYELQIAQTNKALNKDIQTIFYPPKNENAFVSSSMVREIILNKGDISKFVPKCVVEYFK